MLPAEPMSQLVRSLFAGNLLTHSNAYTNDYELSQCQVKDGATVVLGRSYARTDNLNLTGITDQVTAANSATYASTAANRLQGGIGPTIVPGSRLLSSAGAVNTVRPMIAEIPQSLPILFGGTV